VRFNAVAILLTFGIFVGFILSIVTIVVVPATLALQPGSAGRPRWWTGCGGRSWRSSR
jgi:hypothetical protein